MPYNKESNLTMHKSSALPSEAEEKMKSIGWTPAKSVRERIADVTKWTLANRRWIRL